MSQLTEMIERQIERETGISLIVQEDGGDLVLSGAVASDNQRQAVLDTLERAAPGRRVQDNTETEVVAPSQARALTLSEADVEGFVGAEPQTEESEAIEPGDFMDRTAATDPLAASGAGAAELDTDSDRDGERAYAPPIDPVGTNDEVIGGYEASTDSLIASMDTPARGDEELADRARQLLRADAATTDLNVQVEVFQGRATVTGTVPTIDESDMAAEVVARVPGINEVIDDIEVEGGRYV